MIRGLLAEFGIDTPEGLLRALGLARQIAAKEVAPDVPPMAMQILGLLCEQVLDTHIRLQAIDRSILALQRTDDVARRLSTIQASAPSVQRRWRHRSLIRGSSVRVESSPLGSGSHRRKTPVVARTGLATSPRWVIDI